MGKSSKFQLLVNTFSILALLSYLFLLVKHLAPFWFDPEWVTDDSFQQVYPFLKVHQPELFLGDLITDVMEGYLAPAHYGLAYLITYLSGSPIMMSHWMMLIQVVLCGVFFFLFIRKLSDLPTACLATIWLFSIRTVFQRMTGGLPRGWACVIICAFLYFLSAGRHKTILLLLLLGCLLNPPATIMVGMTYGLYLFVHLFTAERTKTIRPFVSLLLACPIYLIVTLKVVERPESIGQMVTYEQALEMPAMRRPDGRFPFAPLLDIPTELRLYAFDAFKHRLAGMGEWQKVYLPEATRVLKQKAPYIFISILSFFILLGYLRRRKIPVPAELGIYFLAIVIVYLLSRLLAFQLYVPDRHLLIPLGIFWVAIFTTVITRSFAANQEGKFQQTKTSFGLLLALALLVFLTNGHGLYGTANFNYNLYKKGKVFAWLKNNTKPDVLIAGHPQHLDALMLFSERMGYITYETSHPFYPKYFEECVRRNEISLKAHYAMTLEEIYNLLAPEKIDYFVFDRKRFYPDKLQSEKYFEPLKDLVNTLTSRDPLSYAFKVIPREINLELAPYQIFRDEFSVVIDVKKLGEYLNSNKLKQNKNGVA